MSQSIRQFLRGLKSAHLQGLPVSGTFSPLAPAQLSPSIRSKLWGKKYLPGSNGKAFPESLRGPGDCFPFAVQADSPEKFSISEWAQLCRVCIRENLVKHGAIIFRNLPLRRSGDFAEICRGLGYKGFTYEAAAVQRAAENEEAKIYTASDEPPDVVIEPHNEMAYAPVVPTKVLFFCREEPGDGLGGETPLIRGSDILSMLDSEVVRAFETRNVKYVRYAASKKPGIYLSWQDTFHTDDKKRVETYLDSNSYKYKWDEANALTFWQTLPAISRHPQTGEKIWFNQVQSHNASSLKVGPRFEGMSLPEHQYPYQTYYGDGTAIEPAVLQHIRDVTWACAVGFQWRNGDLLVVDNFAVQHARMNFSGRRKILVLLSSN